jgi:hypothetical protein
MRRIAPARHRHPKIKDELSRMAIRNNPHHCVHRRWLKLPPSCLHCFDDSDRIQVPNVPICRSERTMSKLRLYKMQRRPLAREFVRVRVPQSVSMDSLIDAGPTSETWKQGADVGRVHRLTIKRAEYRSAHC